MGSCDLMNDTIDLNDKVVAVFDDEEATQAAAADLRAAGRDVEVLSGESGRARLESDAGEGFLASLRAAATESLGDEDRILNQVDDELAEDHSFVVVDVSDSDEEEVAPVLRKHGGHFLWYFGRWTYVRLGDGGGPEV